MTCRITLLGLMLPYLQQSAIPIPTGTVENRRMERILHRQRHVNTLLVLQIRRSLLPSALDDMWCTSGRLREIPGGALRRIPMMMPAWLRLHNSGPRSKGMYNHHRSTSGPLFRGGNEVFLSDSSSRTN